jgi:gamma-glutamylcyclotransferase (GGCT)/AIG2-like uncharacterized protein YtfP
MLFQYGSNLDPEQKEARTGPIREARRARLSRYRLVFNKRAASGGVYANVVKEDDQEVWGVVYLCSPNAIRRMDEKEGVRDGHYRRIDVTVQLETEETTEATTYVAGDEFICPEGYPSDEYLERIIRGARYHGLPEAWIRKVRKAAGREP